MFSTTLRRRPSLSTLIPLLTSSTAPKLHETDLQAHDLALRLQPQPSHPPQQQRPPTQPFLILTPSSLHDPTSTEKITRFSTLTANPAPTIAFLLSTSTTPTTPTASEMPALMDLQTQLHSLPAPPPLLPIPSPHHLLPILKTYTASTSPTPRPPPAPPVPPLALLPHVTSAAPARPLATHATNVLSDLCGSLGEVARMAETERGKEVLGVWLGEEGKGVAEFWEGEWIVE